MSVQFGRWNFDDVPADADYMETMRSLLSPYGPDGEGAYCVRGMNILYRAFHVIGESRFEVQPCVSQSGSVITWDGRLDNRKELAHELSDGILRDAADVSIVAAAFDRWATDCFQRLNGDWALSVWDPKSREVILAKDFVGTRPLYYRVSDSHVVWSSLLEPLLTSIGDDLALDEEYIAGWLSSFPAAESTPYAGVHSVPPSCFVRLGRGRCELHRYWDFNRAKKIRYRNDAEYEEHFRSAVSESIRRRLRSDAPVLAELSGGLDSSSIVCMADELIERGLAETPRLDTLSYFSDSEPNWDERPYFTIVEEKRGRTGCHIDAGAQRPSRLQENDVCFRPTPGTVGSVNEASRHLAAYMASQGHRVVLSGIGGDEVTGGVPTPMPELADLLTRVHLGALAHQLRSWALQMRRPWFSLFYETVQVFLPRVQARSLEHVQQASWLHPDFVSRHRDALSGYQPRLSLTGPLPSFQENMSTLNLLRRQLGCQELPRYPLYDKRYPYLDRDLLEFLYAIPREQLVRPGQRRSLMRRALVGIVPDNLLQRKRKAYVTRLPSASLSVGFRKLIDLDQGMISARLGFVVQSELVEAVQRASCGFESPIVPLMRTLVLEGWLQDLERRGLIHGSKGENGRRRMEVVRISPRMACKNEFSAEEHSKTKGGENNDVHETVY
jgi:asparagine synthase (glutamine-hydrolysing)